MASRCAGRRRAQRRRERLRRPLGLRPTPSYGHYAAQNPYRPISADSRQVPHPSGGGNVPLRAGSIRADVARYNEERGGRPMPPPRAQEESGRSPFSRRSTETERTARSSPAL
jgi:hypothetical protein